MNKPSLTPAQCREARLHLGWTLTRLGAMAGVNGDTVARVETGGYAFRPHTLAAIRAALEAAGVSFVDENGDGAEREAKEFGMTPAQCRAARELIGWTTTRLGSMADISAVTVSKFEKGGPIKPAMVVTLRTTLEAAGVEFIAENGGGPDVRLRREACSE